MIGALLDLARVNSPLQGADMHEAFRKFSQRMAGWVGSPWAFVGAIVLITGWALSGPVFQFSDTWQLVINTGTTIVTFLMVFLIQNTQNRDAKAMHLKLDELLRAVAKARTGLVDLEEMSDAEIAQLQEEFKKLRAQKAQELELLAKGAERRGSTGRRPEDLGDI
jgi:low affinity Fe/Cu permease